MRAACASRFCSPRSSRSKRTSTSLCSRVAALAFSLSLLMSVSPIGSHRGWCSGRADGRRPPRGSVWLGRRGDVLKDFGAVAVGDDLGSDRVGVRGLDLRLDLDWVDIPLVGRGDFLVVRDRVADCEESLGALEEEWIRDGFGASVDDRGHGRVGREALLFAPLRERESVVGDHLEARCRDESIGDVAVGDVDGSLVLEFSLGGLHVCGRDPVGRNPEDEEVPEAPDGLLGRGLRDHAAYLSVSGRTGGSSSGSTGVESTDAFGSAADSAWRPASSTVSVASSASALR
ncbi:hypothetical protein ACFPRL_31955 [Pseudoclavibacter helvolus]